MTFTIKLMSGEDMPDDDTRKTYKLKSGVLDIEFERMGEDSYAWLWFMGGDGCATAPTQLLLHGNVYVMNESGKTVSSFGIAQPHSKSLATNEIDTRVSIPQAVAVDVLNTLDALALALLDHKHRWTAPQRRAYELSIKALGGKLGEHLPLVLQKPDNNKTRG